MSTNVKFGAMSVGEKIVFLGKLVVFICSFGFAFPTLLDDPEYRDSGRKQTWQQTKID